MDIRKREKFMENNEYDIIKGSEKSEISVFKGEGGIEMPQELSVQICTAMVSLGSQLISETGKITIEYFKTQAEMYYGQLNAIIKNQIIKSNERQKILLEFSKLTDRYIELIERTNKKEEREELKNTYKMFSEIQTKLYMDALKADSGGTEILNRPNLLAGLKKIFAKKEN